ncbi:glutathione synthase [Motiliproteus sp. MSK22-1]|uniref:glutathione synthase n=1 Tax=Motiliproteus sp. MSK22-1 TaxID=1897630 RepID=UPI000977FE78|nr:glutathione synthase [Motiliproteus sp. MSK22-1]OMH30224.1 glutathione synthase [Motiliproteus sp. MSK22-1]
MIDSTTTQAASEAVEWSLAHGLAFKTGPETASHVPFNFAPGTIDRDRFSTLKAAVPLLGKLVHAVSKDHQFLQEAITPVATGDAFFGALLTMHQQTKNAQRLPLLIMRSDFMDDAETGPKLVEFNGIAAGMGPFGQRIQELHRFIHSHNPKSYALWSNKPNTVLIDNPAIERLSQAITEAATTIRNEFQDNDTPVFLMVVQEDEDNVYDQHLLEYALHNKGVHTVRRSFRELNGSLVTNPNNRLVLEGVGPIDCVYLRAGYEYCDYAADDLHSQNCCETLMQTRVLIENHRVAVNATVSQQLATSKRVQMMLSSMTAEALTQFGLTLYEATAVKSLLGKMLPVSANTVAAFSKQNPSHWVLKNQGEGGGHCIFDNDILPKLQQLPPEEYSAWALMQRLRPLPRSKPALIVRKSELMVVDDLISEIGMFTVHINGQSTMPEAGYAGYLIRSKSAQTTEGGIHSGMGVLDSLAFNPGVTSE